MKRIFKYITTLIITLLIVLFGTSNIYAQETESQTATEPLQIHLFYGKGCPHCAKEEAFLNKKLVEWGDSVVLNTYEVYYIRKNQKLLSSVAETLDTKAGGVPFLVVGDEYIAGYNSDETTGEKITKLVEKCLEKGCENVVQKVIDNNGEVIRAQDDNNEPTVITIPLIGDVDLRKMSLPVATVLIGFMDGFNPCAMWILIFLISMLINMKDKKKLYILGSTFIITSAVVYFGFLAAWFNFFKIIGTVSWIKLIIGIVAVVSGSLHLKNAIEDDGTCKVIKADKKKNIMDRIKKVIHEQSFWLAFGGIIVLAVSVNMVELVCSAGLPAIYTNLLSGMNFSPLTHYGYLLLYVFVFMLDDLIVFFLSIKTFEIAGITNKYARISNIVGGVLILIIGILLIFKPELLMFG